jgi:hypothetical protein
VFSRPHISGRFSRTTYFCSGGRFFWNLCKYLPNYTPSHPIKQQFSKELPLFPKTVSGSQYLWSEMYPLWSLYCSAIS